MRSARPVPLVADGIVQRHSPSREWALILDGWSREGASGADLVHRGIGNLKSEGAFARMPYWLSLLADLSARDSRPAPRGPPLTPRSPPGASTTTCGGCPR